MPFDRFLIAPINTGLQTDLKPFLIMDDAFERLENAYVFRGRIKKRFGSLLMGNPPSIMNSRLRINLGNTDGSGNFSGTVPGNVFAIGQAFSVGTEIFTVYQTGTPATMLDTGAATVKTYNTSTGAVVINGAAATTAVYFYPALPVMGITQYESGTVNNHPTYAFDQEFAYIFSNSNGGWNRSGTGSTPLWHGGNTNYFWTSNWQGTAGTPIMFVTNFNATVGTGPYPAATDDPIWTFNETTWTSHPGSSSANGFFFLPAGGAVGAGPFIQTARIIVPFKNRLVLLNTIENDNSNFSITPGTGITTAYVNRCRYSFNGSPFAVNAWYEPNQTDSSGNVAAGAGFIDAATEEQIISAEFIKDRLIVYFERSTWELAYTGNEILPFVWQKINTELGSQSTFSTVPFDKEILTIGNTGIHACNGANVQRIDSKIPDEVFEFKSLFTYSTFGIRDFYSEAVYWTFSDDTVNTTLQNFPNRILVYNYANNSWALNDDCITAFGYFEQQEDTTWASSAPQTWEQTGSTTWIDGIQQADLRQILIGNPEGFVVRLSRDVASNAQAMQITNITFASSGILTLTIVNHNLSSTGQFVYDDDFISIANVVGDSATETFLNGSIFPVYQVTDANTITINTFGGLTTGTYNGGGTISRVSNVQILSKQYNPYLSRDRNIYLHKVDFAVQKTATGQITVDYYPSDSQDSMITDGTANGMIMGNNILETSPYDPAIYPFEQQQIRLWHPIYFQTTGECIQLFLYFSPDQMVNPNISLSDFEMEGFVLYTSATSQRLQ